MCIKKTLYTFFVLFSIGISLHAQVVSKSTPEIPENILSVRLREALPVATIKINGLKAVLIGAPIDGDQGSWTTSEIKNLKQTAQTLRQNGVTVYEFYTPENNWETIKKAAAGAQFLMYRGHGVYDGNEPPDWVGGFALKDKFASSDIIKQDLKLAPGAIVMVYGCFTAGNSGSDIGKINLKEAQRRVAMYSRPFMEIGAAGYYANWYGDAFQHFVAHLFAGKSLGNAYKDYEDFNSETVNYTTHPNAGDKVLWVDHDDWSGQIAYNNAFVGEPNVTLSSLFSGQGSSVNEEIEKPKEEKKTTTVKKTFVSMSYLSELEKQVVRELNTVRRNPKGYAKHLAAMKKYFNGKIMNIPGEDASIMTNEGVSAVNECYDFLMNAEPIDTLRPSQGLSQAAEDHVDDQGPSGDTGHDGSDGSSPFDRIERYGQWLSTAGENIDYGNDEARRIVLSLLIDDGVASRGHRDNIFNSAFKVVGVACGPHKKYRNMCVMNFAGGFKKKSGAVKLRGEDDDNTEEQ